MNNMVHLENVSKIFRTKRGPVKALDELTLHVREGEFVVIRGPSGCGKTTVLLTAGAMQHPTQGTVRIAGDDIYALSTPQRAAFRAQNIGFVFQMFHLVPYLSILENVMLAANRKNNDRQDQARALIGRLGISDRIDHKPADLSAGERQRTAIARALISHPRIILADEPTGNLDPDNAAEVMRYLADYHHAGGTVIVVTHGAVADQHADRIIHLQQGSVVQ
jgi:ABC-type lipoprotein export system ATPase subunit